MTIKDLQNPRMPWCPERLLGMGFDPDRAEDHASTTLDLHELQLEPGCAPQTAVGSSW